MHYFYSQENAYLKLKLNIKILFLPGLHQGPSCMHAASPLTVKNWRKLGPEAAGGVCLQGRKQHKQQNTIRNLSGSM